MSESFILKPNKGATHRKKRLGAGPGSGHGSTCARGHDGQRSRSGKKRPYVAFEGGQMPLYRRVPKRGFFHMKADSISFNVSDLNRLENGALVSIEKLIEQKIVKNPLTRIYILGDGEITKKVNVEVHRISSSAKEKIEKAGGLVKVLEG